MIHVSSHFDLGLDRTRIKDPQDADRQRTTVAAILERFFHHDPDRRWEIQIVADEVGMGKTFVALALAYSILAHLREGGGGEDLRGCYQKVLVVTPQNSALFEKWRREVAEFVRRCVVEGHREEAEGWFAPQPVTRLDDLACEIRKPGKGPRILVTHMGVFGGGKLERYDLKRRFMLGVLFRYWGIRFRIEARQRLLRGAPDGWPRDPGALTDVGEDGLVTLPFADQDDALRALEGLDREDDGSVLQALLQTCREISEPYTRDRTGLFDKVERALVEIYRRAVFVAVRQALPLVVVDEAHNWKNGPSRNANGYQRFAQFVAPRIRRALLLTATPFQLRPDEMLEILKLGEHIEPCATQAASRSRRERLTRHRESVVRPVLGNAAEQSRRFARAWPRMPHAAASGLGNVWDSLALVRTRAELSRIALAEGVIEEGALGRIVDGAVAGIDPDLREIVRESLRLYAYNLDLSQELGAFVIRHRRRTDHRLVRVGVEYHIEAARTVTRSDRHILHSAPGIDVRGPGELPHYLLMRCVSEMKKGRGRSSLGSALTGCYSTLLESAEGRGLQKNLGSSPVGKAYLGLLLEMVGERQDAEHPKVRELSDAVLRNWERGEKTLIFCFRTHTAHRLRDITDARIGAELQARRDRVLGGKESLRALRARFTGRDRDLIVLGLDRVLWSLAWAAQSDDIALHQIAGRSLGLQDDEFETLARLALRYGVDLTAERVDRVFLHRAVEHIIACRLACHLPKHSLFTRVIQDITQEWWIRSPYGLEAREEEAHDHEGGDELPHFDERGVHSTYEMKVAAPRTEDVRILGHELRQRRERARRQGQISIVDVYGQGPSFWLGPEPIAHLHAPGGDLTALALTFMHRHLFELSRAERAPDWGSRLLVFQALRRALLRESILLRLLPERSDREEAGWGELLVRALFDTLPGQSENMADRLGVFLEDLRAASGSVHKAGTARHTMYDATRLRGHHFVTCVDGNTPPGTRERIFAGFNSPLLPEVLICTTVGQEGIDLHRHCRHVVHYDLAWNPAVLEQRTGRVDRIGSKTFRERTSGGDAFLDVGVPFLAGTYDERMYEELRLRAQIFEVLTGGDIGADNIEGRDDIDGSEDKEQSIDYASLPANLMADLRVQLHVWHPHAGLLAYEAGK